ncbi:uracil phosphoribosyltransferase [Turneriella parva]|uniref:Uracil phosphoribosyltransferase n=1 Tax=Turneriella parva (strain ATCC BAA-1111 / DSM 21527 / NCTC 11395 / H) TaxID=869212 RepID=I4B6H9_TURPD|nr:uracil phosphoribosyltransferase [Turneriella parva]AFM12886.1 uracil phosphoribosyltransferase [Turneriella parva DSM 21527]
MKTIDYTKHALLQTKITLLRDKKTPYTLFARTMNEISTIMCALISAELAVQKTTVLTPLMKAAGTKLKRPIVLVPILRAGLGLLEGFRQLIPEASVGHVGVERDHVSLRPRFYYYKTPALKDAEVWVLDPMLATGGSLDFTLGKLKEHKPAMIRAISVLAAPEGLRHVEKAHSDVQIYAAAIDNKLNNKGYILPGLGDAGDRYFNS